MHAYWEHLQQLVAAGKPFVSVTLVDVVASAPANVGAKMLVTEAGLSYGTVGGGKVEMRAIAEAQGMLRGENTKRDLQNAKHETQNTKPDSGQNGGGVGGLDLVETTRFVEWNLQRDVGMTCGGAVRLFFEAYNMQAWPVVIFGAGHCSQALLRLLLTMQCQVTVIDGRDEWLAKLPTGCAGKLRVVKAERPSAEYVKELPQNAFVLLMTMGHASDQPILIEILKTRTGAEAFPYVGVIGSEAKAGALKRGLLAAGLDEVLATAHGYEESQADGYYCPIGLPVGTNDPAEIAVSVAAQLLQRRNALRAQRTT